MLVKVELRGKPQSQVLNIIHGFDVRAADINM